MAQISISGGGGNATTQESTLQSAVTELETLNSTASTIDSTTQQIQTDTNNLANKDFATETTLQSIDEAIWLIHDEQLPASLGQKNASQSLAVTVASDQAPVPTYLTAYEDIHNSSTTPLAANGVYTGSSINIEEYATISVAVATDVASAAGGLGIQFSPNGTNWDHLAHAIDVAAGGVSYNIPVELRYYRIVYTNGSSAQAYFRLTSTLRRMYVPPSVYTMTQGVYDGTLAAPTKSVIFGKTTGGGGGYVAVKVNPSGALTVESTISGTVAVSGPLTDAQLRATAVPVSGTFWQATQPVSGTFWQATQPVSGPLTDAELRASAISTTAAANTNGTIVNTSLVNTTASTATKPANAVGFILQAPSTNTDNIRYCIGGVASTTVGMLMEPGRDTGYVPCAANISICATVSGTNAFSIQWVLSA